MNKSNPMAVMKLLAVKNQFTGNHPKFAAFLKAFLKTGVEEGTIIEVTVQRPGQPPVTSNLRVLQEDLELLQELREYGR